MPWTPFSRPPRLSCLGDRRRLHLTRVEWTGAALFGTVVPHRGQWRHSVKRRRADEAACGTRRTNGRETSRIDRHFLPASATPLLHSFMDFASEPVNSGSFARTKL